MEWNSGIENGMEENVHSYSQFVQLALLNLG